jgi:transforming growth factor-beta-induced protein
MSMLSGRLTLALSLTLALTAACSDSKTTSVDPGSSGGTSSGGVDDAGAAPVKDSGATAKDSGTTPDSGQTTPDSGSDKDAGKALVDIVETAKAAGSFNTLVELVGLADLATTLKGAGPFTVLAPTDAAFGLLPPAVVAALKMPANKALLQQVLTYHVISGSVPSTVVVTLNGKSAASVEGENLDFTVAGANVTINKTTKVTAVDVKASNGIIHILDSVLISPVVAAKLDAAGKDIVDTAVAAGTFNSLAGALMKAELVATLKGPGPFTVFAPTDDAFTKLGDISGLTKEQLAPLLTYHVVAGLVGSAAVVGLNGKDVKTVNGKTFKVTVAPAGVTLTDGKGGIVKVTSTDIATKNGLIHVLDTVLMPAP